MTKYIRNYELIYNYTKKTVKNRIILSIKGNALQGGQWFNINDYLL